MGTSHLLFARMSESREQALDDAAAILSKRYAMDFRLPADRYAALGTPADMLAFMRQFHDVGVRHFILNFLGTPAEQTAQAEQFAVEFCPRFVSCESGSRLNPIRNSIRPQIEHWLVLGIGVQSACSIRLNTKLSPSRRA